MPVLLNMQSRTLITQVIEEAAETQKIEQSLFIYAIELYN